MVTLTRGFAKFLEVAGIVLASVVALAVIVLLLVFFFEAIAILQIFVLGVVAVGSALATCLLVWWIATQVWPWFIRLVVVLPPPKKMVLPKYIRQWANIASVTLLVAGGVGLTAAHIGESLRVYPIFEEFEASASCGDYEVLYDGETLVERDRIVREDGFVRLPWTGWVHRCDSLPSGTFNFAVYVWVPWL